MKLFIVFISFFSMFFSCTIYKITEPSKPSNLDYKGMNIFFQPPRNAFDINDFTTNAIELSSIGVNRAFLVPYYFSNNKKDNNIFSTSRTIIDSDLISAIQVLRSNGIESAIKPHIDLLDGSPRFEIDPTDYNVWLANYKSFINHYIEIAKSNNIEMFVIGTELDKVSDKDGFLSYIDEIKNDYDGKIIYAPSWYHFIASRAIKKVDYIGVNGYFQLSKTKETDLYDLVKNWSTYLDFINSFASRMNKNVIFTELGYINRNGTAINPGDFNFSGKNDEQEQADCYESFLLQVDKYPRIKGVFWWQWELNDIGGSDNIDYTPRDKKAENILKKYWK